MRKLIVVKILIICCLSLCSCILNTSSLITYKYEQLNNSTDKKYKLQASMASTTSFFDFTETNNNFENIEKVIICSEGNDCYEMDRHEYEDIFFTKIFAFSRTKFKEIFDHDTVYIKLISENEIQRLKFLKQELNTYKN